MNGCLSLYSGNVKDIFIFLIEQYTIKFVFWNKCYEQWNVKQEEIIKTLFKDNLIEYMEFNSNYFCSPKDILKDNGDYYKVFAAYKNKLYKIGIRKNVVLPKNIKFFCDFRNTLKLSDLKLMSQNNWHKNIEKLWDFGKAAAQRKLNQFIEKNLSGYSKNRNHPSKCSTSKLSPHLHFGEISPTQIWNKITENRNKCIDDINIESFLNEIIWHDFSCYLLYHFNFLHVNNFNNKFNNFQWLDNEFFINSWKKGKTGYPLIDAGMRELWKTGYIHNRVRMAVVSFLIKNLNIHWHIGRDWFWDCLFDADLGINSTNWQWVAGCGVDPVPYFRIFNSITQGEKFDKNGKYTRKYLPELKHMPDNYLFKPWMAKESILKSANVVIGKDYPAPIVDLAFSRNLALDRYRNL